MSAFDGAAAVEMMMHACGHMRSRGRLTRRPYRNHYCASTEDAATWDVLVTMGLATCRLVDGVPDAVYHVTPAGVSFLWERCKAARVRS